MMCPLASIIYKRGTPHFKIWDTARIFIFRKDVITAIADEYKL